MKILNLLNESSDYKIVTRKWNIISDQANANNDAGNDIINSTEVWKSNLCDYTDAYIQVKANVTIIEDNWTQVAFKNCAPFTKCITKIDGIATDDNEDLDLVMPMYNVFEYNSNCFDTTGSLWFYSNKEATNFNADIENNADFQYF